MLTATRLKPCNLRCHLLAGVKKGPTFLLGNSYEYVFYCYLSSSVWRHRMHYFPTSILQPSLDKALFSSVLFDDSYRALFAQRTFFHTSLPKCDKSIEPLKNSSNIPPLDPKLVSAEINIGLKKERESQKPDHLEKQPLTKGEAASTEVSTKIAQKKTDEKKSGRVKRALVKAKDEFMHFFNGLRLLWLDIKIATKLLYQLAKTGRALSRRERRQLIRTVADIFRMVPFIVFMVVPMLEFVIPFYLKLFPSFLPSTLRHKDKAQETVRQALKVKLEMAKFLQDTLKESASHKSQPSDAPSVKDFANFIAQVRESGEVADLKDIMKYSVLFEDEITLDTLDYKQLSAMCKLLNINPVGPTPVLRFQLWLRMRNLMAEDAILAKEDIEKLHVEDLQQLCRERGMRAMGISENRLRFQLRQWLSLHLEKKVPAAFLLFTRTMYLPDYHTTEEQLKMAMTKIPETLEKEAKLKISETVAGERTDRQTKIELLKEETKAIEQERAELERQKKEELIDKAPSVTTERKEEMLKDSAASVIESEISVALSSSPSHVEEQRGLTDTIEMVSKGMAATPADLDATVTSDDLSQIETAIVNLEESKRALDEQNLEDIEEDAESLQANQQVIVDNIEDDNKSAKKLSKKVDKMIADVDEIAETLHVEQTDEGSEGESKVPDSEEIFAEEANSSDDNVEKIRKAIEKKQQRSISISDLMVSLKTLQKAPNNEKWQKNSTRAR